MSTTTPNFGWQVPTSTDFVKDGAVAIETLGDAIDASLVDLKGGITGQVLSKNTNADMDFTWVTPNDADAIQNTIVDAKGDLITATAADTPARLGVGANGQVLTADSTAATGLKWASPAAGEGWTQVSTGTTTSGSALNITGLSGYDKYMFWWYGVSDTANASLPQLFRFNSDSANNYQVMIAGITSGPFFVQSTGTSNAFGSQWQLDSNSPTYPMLAIEITGCLSTTAHKKYRGMYYRLTESSQCHFWGIWKNTSALTSINSSMSSGNYDAGTWYLWGSN